MEAGLILLSIYILLYAVYIGRLFLGFGQVPTAKSHGSQPKTTFSIVVPFRNEEFNLPTLLESIRRIDYPKEFFEIILIDDDSVDHSQRVVYKWRMANGEFHTTMIENVRVSGSPKKDAIARAVPIVANEWIITTDADCVLPEKWLATLNDFIIGKNVSMIAGPVVYSGKNSFRDHFQRMDLMSLQAATIGGFGLGKAFMCNGANFAYTKKLFRELSGFSGNEKTASGDDVFLLQKAAEKFPEAVGYLKSADAIVITKPERTWKSLFFQRVRWASKTASYQSEFGETLAWVVFLANLSLVGLTVLAILRPWLWLYPVAAFLLKFTIDFALLIRANSFLRSGRFFFPLASAVVYPFFCVAVALYSVYGKYEWKGRKHR
jgi:cellulose synthase/poly-beta-1,6-N-acetylglucosamine synthase-like glycosyltransferase